MKRKLQGKWVRISTVGEIARAFVPAPLPPIPPINWNPLLRNKFDEALLSLGRLDSVSSLLPDNALFLYTYVRKEAVLSSMIEGTQSSLSDLLLFELDQEPGVPLDDVKEVSNYVAALDHGLERLKSGFPISLRLIREIHGILLSKGRGSHGAPGEFRRSQNWIGGTRPGNAAFVPPPASELLECLNKLEMFIHDKPEPTPVLLKAALVHVQFETIHPFLDGNGRLGRLLITLLLRSQNTIQEPTLYLSLYFKAHRRQYYELLNEVHLNGNWEAWLEFFADAVIFTANQAVETAKRLAEISNLDRAKINDLGKSAPTAQRVHRIFMEHPIASSNFLVEKSGLTAATINAGIRRLEDLGIIKQITDRKRNRVFSYAAFFEILNRGLEPIGD